MKKGGPQKAKPDVRVGGKRAQAAIFDGRPGGSVPLARPRPRPLKFERKTKMHQAIRMQGRRSAASSRAQAAIFDGITLLLLAAVSSSLIFVFVSGYGVQQDRVLRSAYILNYMQSAVKASYYIDASTLSKVDNVEHGVDARGNPVTNPLEIYQDLADPTTGCPALKSYSGSFSVSELLKRDLAEKSPALDDKFDGTDAMGVTAYKCAVKELMKPFWYAGFYYGFDVVDVDAGGGSTVPVAKKTDHPPYLNNRLVTDYPDFLKSGVPAAGICSTAQTVSPDVVSVQVPFKVVYVDTSANPPVRALRNYALAFCIWHPAQ